MNEDSPATDRSQIPSPPTDPDQLIRVEEGLLVIPTGCTMPPICVVTNRPVRENDMVQKELYWCSSWVGISMIVSWPLLIFMYLLARERCTITYGLDRRIWIGNVVWRVLAALAAIGFLIATLFLVALIYSPWLFVPTSILFVISLANAVSSRSPLTVAKCRNGMFWVKGFRPEYLAQLPLEA